MIPMMPNTNTPDVLGALSGRPAGMMGGSIGMLANAPGNGMGGLARGALSSPGAGGMSPQMLQMMLMKAGGGLLAGTPVNQVLGGAAQDLVPMAMQAQMARQQGEQAQQEMQPGQDPQQEEMMRTLAMLKAKGMLGGSEGPTPGTSTSPFVNRPGPPRPGDPGGPIMGPGYGSLAGLAMPAEAGPRYQ